MEKAGFKNIQKLLEISEREQHHEIILTVRNLHELSRNPSPYILPVIPHPLSIEIEEGEHYVIVDLLNLALGSQPRLLRPRWLVGNWKSAFGLSILLWLERIPALPPKHLRRLIGVAVYSVFLLRKRIPVLPPSIQEGKAGA